MPYNFKQAFIHAVNTPSDINEHLPLMNLLAKLCNHVTEFGVRWGTSCKAWLNNDVVVRGYDITAFPEAVELFGHAQAAGKDAQLILRDTLSLETLEYTDMLFIDSLHTYSSCCTIRCCLVIREKTEASLALVKRYVNSWRPTMIGR